MFLFFPKGLVTNQRELPLLFLGGVNQLRCCVACFAYTGNECMYPPGGRSKYPKIGTAAAAMMT